MSVSASIDMDEIMDELTVEDLIEELKKRRKEIPKDEDEAPDFERVLALMRERRFDDAELLLERLIHPKYRDVDSIMRALAERKTAQ